MVPREKRFTSNQLVEITATTKPKGDKAADDLTVERGLGKVFDEGCRPDPGVLEELVRLSDIAKDDPPLLVAHRVKRPRE